VGAAVVILGWTEERRVTVADARRRSGYSCTDTYGFPLRRRTTVESSRQA